MSSVYVTDWENWIRVSLAINICLKDALIQILHAPQCANLPRNKRQLYHILIIFKQKEAIYLKKIVSASQWDLICHVCTTKCPVPCTRQGQSSTEDLDITCICILLRNIDKIAVGFDMNILQNFFAFIEDSRKCRNHVMHSDKKEFSTPRQFNNFWLRIETNLKGLGYQNLTLFHELKTCSLEPYMKQQIDGLHLKYLHLNETKSEKSEIERLEKLIKEMQAKMLTKDEVHQILEKDSQTQKDYEDTSMALKLKRQTQKLYGRMKIPTHPKCSLVTDNVINRDEVIVNLSMVNSQTSVFHSVPKNLPISKLREQQRDLASAKIDYSQVVMSLDDYVIISGVPGSGKTTLMETLLFKWSINDLWCQFSYVFIVYLRKLVRFKGRDDITAERILSYFYPEYNFKEITRKENILLILEGFDELYGRENMCGKNEHFNSYTQAIYDLFDPDNPTLSCARVVTSRPDSCHILFDTVLSSHNKQTIYMVTGFSNENITKYIENSFPDGLQVVEKLKEVPAVFDMMMIPFYAWGICFLIKNEVTIQELGQSQTSLYANLLLLFIRNHGFRNKGIRLKDVCQQEEFKSICVGLSSLAFQMEQTGRMNFTKNDIPKEICLQDLLQQSGLLLQVDDDTETFYQFLHYTFHEFLVSLHIFINGIRSLDVSNLQVTSMLAGLLGGASVNSKSNLIVQKISKLFGAPNFTIRNVISTYFTKEIKFSYDLLCLIYEFHNSIPDLLQIQSLLESCPKGYCPNLGEYKQFFTNLCLNEGVHFTIDMVLLGTFADTEITSSLLKCSKCKEIVITTNKDEHFKAISKTNAQFQKISISNQWDEPTENQFVTCMYHAEAIQLSIFRNNSTDFILKLLRIMKEGGTERKTSKLVLLFSPRSQYVDVMKVLQESDVCEEIILSWWSNERALECRNDINEILHCQDFETLKSIKLAVTFYKNKVNKQTIKIIEEFQRRNKKE